MFNRGRQLANTGTSKGLLATEQNASQLIGLDEDEVRDTIMTLSAQDPKQYMQFRNSAIYGSNLKEDADTVELGDMKLGKGDDIKSVIKKGYMDNTTGLLDGKGELSTKPIYNKSPLRAFVPPHPVMSGLPASIQRDLATEAYEMAYNQAVSSFNKYFPESFQRKQVHTDDENKGFTYAKPLM